MQPEPKSQPDKKHPKQILNEQYSSLAQQLGDSIIKLDKLQLHIENLKKQIETLNEASIVIDSL